MTSGRPSLGSLSSARAACEEVDYDAEEGHNARNDGVKDVANTADNSHDGISDGSEQARDLKRKVGSVENGHHNSSAHGSRTFTKGSRTIACAYGTANAMTYTRDNGTHFGGYLNVFGMERLRLLC